MRLEETRCPQFVSSARSSRNCHFCQQMIGGHARVRGQIAQQPEQLDQLRDT